MNYRKIVMAGGGVLGSQIAYQSAYKGFDVTIWGRSDASIDRVKARIEKLHAQYAADLGLMNTPEGKTEKNFAPGLADDPNTFTEEVYRKCLESNDKAFAGMKYETDLAKAVADADLVIEAIAESRDEKTAFYETMAPLLPEKTVVLTNSSTLLPSMFAEATGRPEKFAALHFANRIWYGNTADIMGHAGTPSELLDDVCEFAKAISMIPLRLNKEQPGYILNTLLVPLFNAALYLWAFDVADYESIDLAWKTATGGGMGPFEMLDLVGLTTPYNIASNKPEAADPTSVVGGIAVALKRRIDAGLIGRETGEGFYKYN